MNKNIKRHIKVLNKRWELRFSTMKDDFGDCDPPDKTYKQIRIDKTLEGKKLLEILIHECLHAANWSLDEDWVKYTSRDIASILWRLGYREGDS